MQDLRTPLPGEVMEIHPREAHCLSIAITFFQEDPVFHVFLEKMFNERFLQTWSEILRVESQKYDFKQALTWTKLTPLEDDRRFLEALVATELVNLRSHPPREERMDCGHYPYDHEEILGEFTEREIELPKAFENSRRLQLESTDIQEKILGKSILSRKEVEKLIEERMKRLRRRFLVMDLEDLDEFDLNPPEGYSRDATAEALARSHESTIEDARQQLLELLERDYHIVDD